MTVAGFWGRARGRARWAPASRAALAVAFAVMHVVMLVVMLAVGACGDDGGGLHPPGGATVWLAQAGSTEDGQVIEILFQRPAGVTGPRVVELFLDRSESLELVASEAGEAAVAAGKSLTTQEPSPARIRLVLLATGSLLEIDTGVLVRLTLRGSGTLAFDGSSPEFAPREAEAAAVLGPALEL